MPELPEVEVTRRSMTGVLEGRTVRALRVYERRLRWPVPRGLAATLAGRRLQRIDRRGKYLLWRFEHGVLISHLGMTGSWRLYPYGAAPERGPHDHVARCWRRWAWSRSIRASMARACTWPHAGDRPRSSRSCWPGTQWSGSETSTPRRVCSTRASIRAFPRGAWARRAAPGLPRRYGGCWPRPSRRADRRCAITHRPMARRGSMRCKHACTAAMARTARCAAVQFEGSYRVSAPHTGARFASGAEYCGRRPCRGVAVETLVRPRGLT